MKKIKKTKLSLDAETIKQLDDSYLSRAAGGATLGCSQATCGTATSCWATCATCFCGTQTQYPCASGQHGCA